MKASELRIGNWYRSVKFNVPVKCDITDFYDLCAKSDGATEHPPIDEMFEPIPLTEEWLLKFGFTLDCEYTPYGKAEIYRNDDMDVVLSGVFKGVNIPYVCDDSFIVNVKHVHQLQNLYFALTGEELEVKK